MEFLNPVFSADPRFDILRIRMAAPMKSYTVPIGVDRATMARIALAEALPGDTLVFGAGTYFFKHQDGNVKLPSGVALVGAGMGRTIFQSDVHSDAEGTGFVLRNTLATNMTFQHLNTYVPDEDGRCIGFDPDPGQTAGYTAELYRCEVIGDAWLVYNWNNLGNRLTLDNCRLKFGRVGIAAMGSGSPTSQFITAIRCVFDGDASRAVDIGATSSALYGGVYGAVCRGGVTKIIDCEMNLKGKASVAPSFTPVVYGVSDTFELNADGTPVAPHSAASLQVLNLRCQINANGSTKVKDINFQWPNIKAQSLVSGGWGSGPNGAFIGL